jgi:hypothetical protein
MESRLTFLHRFWLSLEDTGMETGRLLKVTVPQGDVEATAKADLLKCASRKASGCSQDRPYRKPTQVGG